MAKIIRIDTLHSGDKRSCSTNGNGVRIIAWFCGCDVRCSKECHNQGFWDFDNPNFEDFSEKHIELIINEQKKYPNIYSGLSVLGGEPFSIKNIDDAITLCCEYKKVFNDKNIWIWTGHTLDWLNKQKDEYGEKIQKLLTLCDYVVDGPFDINKRDITLKFRGSSNQTIWEKDGNNEWIESEMNNN